MQGDMGWYDTSFGRAIAKIRLWNKIIQLDENRLSRKIFEADFNICRNNWASNIKELCRDLNLENEFNNKQVICFDTVKNTLKEKFIADWQNAVSRKPKLRTYAIFKTTFETEEYAKHCKNRKERSFMAQLRLGILPLAIETGRYRNVPLEERLCESCRIIEDEKHFLLHCPLYNQH